MVTVADADSVAVGCSGGECSDGAGVSSGVASTADDVVMTDASDGAVDAAVRVFGLTGDAARMVHAVDYDAARAVNPVLFMGDRLYYRVVMGACHYSAFIPSRRNVTTGLYMSNDNSSDSRDFLILVVDGESSTASIAGSFDIAGVLGVLDGFLQQHSGFAPTDNNACDNTTSGKQCQRFTARVNM